MVTVVTIFIDMKKAFDTINKQRLTYKLHEMGIQNKNLDIIKSYLQHRPQRTKIKNTLSDIEYPKFGLPQGGSIPPLLYILYTNDIVNIGLRGKLIIYADDICLTYSTRNVEQLRDTLNRDAKLLEAWCEENMLTINEKKSNFIIFNNTKSEKSIEIKLKGTTLQQVTETNYLGLHMNSNLRWDTHINNIIKKNSGTIAAVRRMKSLIPTCLKPNIYNAIYTSKVNYLINIWGNTTCYNINKLQRQQNKILKILHNLPTLTSTLEVHQKTNEITIQQRIEVNNLLLLYKIQNNQIKTDLKFTHSTNIHNHGTRNHSHIRTHGYKTKRYSLALTTDAVNRYNKLPNNIKQLGYQTFKLKIKHMTKSGQI